MRRNRGRLNDALHVTISISIEIPLLQNIEKNVKGNSRSEKIEKCVEIGYIELTKEKEKTKE